ncbi:uncharacterized protein NFIA_048490 [Aspergillus fischeri NRRL 181]|uniref:FluG domain protein n=1 Tax=Neosartorya fischeri (strain ATCC 1020 / DSM 3700 / CBS 544.65 / FGSC A1164 / JCM 1740 / NRRL 181 / WB 181) TaxID=331117 RepID=A1DL41_NEOFI|nr:conserved hypothetical protein [Aspergillus fischeri NRRL 181]EAW15512.1 conserved hypothetical protein [Aspergillus fischeri NRRL 181]
MSPPPLPPADPNEHQYWTDPILCEETRARLEHFRSVGWLPPNFKPKTLEGLAVVERYWRRFCIHSKEDYVEYLLLEDQTIYMNFFDWMYRTSRQKLLQSYDEYWRRLCQYFALFARRRLNGNVYEQMRRFLNKVFPAERKIPRRMKKKDTLDVNVFCILYRHHWMYSRFFRHGSMIIQFAIVQLWSAITGTRLGVLLPQKASQTGQQSSLGKRKRKETFQSDLPKHVSADDLPDSVCYGDIELFILKDPDSKRDVLCAIIEFRNLKGRPEGADGTKFFMHGDYQMAYCPINQIISLAFRDGAFLNALTPELIWRLHLPLRWKPELLDTPLLQHIERTPHGYELHESLPMTYDSSRQALKKLGNFTSQERQRVLGQSGDAVFERHYQSQFIGRDLQHVLLRPSQEGLLRVAGSMLRKRDPLAPSGLTDQQKRAICHDPRILELRREQRELKEEMRSLAGIVAKARESFPHLHERHEAVKKELSRSDAESCEDVDSDDEDWDIPIPEYVFPERVRLVENFYGPEAECFDADKLLARRIQVTKDMVALSKLCEPSRRGNPINWAVSDDTKADETEREESEESPPSGEEALDCLTDVCIVCCGLSRRSASNPPPHKFPSKRKDSLRRHLIDVHLARAHEGISCTWAACCDVPKFTKATEFLAHAVDVHSYDIQIKLKHLPSKPLLTCSDTSSIDSTDASLESCGRSGTSTPASSVGPATENIDPRLLELEKDTVTEAPPRRSKRLRR